MTKISASSVPSDTTSEAIAATQSLPYVCLMTLIQEHASPATQDINSF